MADQKITSLTNEGVKRVVRLRNQKDRAESGLTIVEGTREITRAQEAGVPFKEIYYCYERPTNTDKNVPVYETTESVFSKIAYGDKTRGVLAVCAPAPQGLSDLPVKEKALYVIVESVEKPGNLGAILRTCDTAGVSGVIVCDGKTDVFNPNVIRASLGTVFSVGVVVSNNTEALTFLKTNNIEVIATLPEAQTVYTDADLKGSLAIIVGSERDGLTDFWSQNANHKVKIPMNGHADSLNVSVSTAILLYEAIRQRS